MAILEKENIKEGFIHTWLGTRFSMLAIDPETIKLFLKSSEDFPKQTSGVGGGSKYMKESFGNNLVSVNGDDWRRHRTFVNSGFTTKAYTEYFPTFCQMTEKTLSKISNEMKQKNDDIEINRWFSKFTLDLLGNSIFHYDFGRLDDKSTEAYNSYTQLLQQAGTFFGRLLQIFPWLEKFPLPGVKQIHNSVGIITSLFHQIINERKNGKKYDDILNNLLNSTQTEGTKGSLSQNELISNLWIFFLAGHETTSTALTSACLCLAKYPDIQEKVYQEIQQTVGNEIPTLEDLSKLKYMECFISEVLRVHPPVPFLPTRVASRDVKVKDQMVPKGTTVGLFISMVHKHPDFWPNPEKFDPDRFLPENKKGRHHYAYVPFSLGPRQCIGNHFSLIEQHLFLTCLLQKFRVLPPKNSPLHDTPIRFGSTEPIQIHLEHRQ